MKHLLFQLLFLATIISFSSCSSDETYEDLLNAEKELISNYIEQNNINVIETLPTNNNWGANDYYKTSDGFYIHIVDTGEIGAEVKTGQKVMARYYKISLQTPPDTVRRNWTTSESAYPEEIVFDLITENPIPSKGIQKAISIMKRHNSAAKIIVPSKLGTTEDKDAVIPYFYDLKIKLIE